MNRLYVSPILLKARLSTLFISFENYNYLCHSHALLLCNYPPTVFVISRGICHNIRHKRTRNMSELDSSTEAIRWLCTSNRHKYIYFHFSRVVLFVEKEGLISVLFPNIKMARNYSTLWSKTFICIGTMFRSCFVLRMKGS